MTEFMTSAGLVDARKMQYLHGATSKDRQKPVYNDARAMRIKGEAFGYVMTSDAYIGDSPTIFVYPTRGLFADIDTMDFARIAGFPYFPKDNLALNPQTRVIAAEACPYEPGEICIRVRGTILPPTYMLEGTQSILAYYSPIFAAVQYMLLQTDEATLRVRLRNIPKAGKVTMRNISREAEVLQLR